MTNCERCGKEIPENVAICPNCGTVTLMAKNNPQPPTKHGQYQDGYAGTPPGNTYPPQQYYQAPPQQYYQEPSQQGYGPQQQNYGYGQPYYTPPVYQQTTVNVNMVNPTTTNNTPLIVEILLNVFLGIYGVGWLMSGETTVGVILLICSILLYWPTLILGTIFTFGLGLCCLGPLAIGAIILNAVLLNNRLKQKAATYMPIPPM